MTNPYKLPDGNVQIAFSGGRTSAYMLWHLIEANGLDEINGDRVVVAFQNTGREMPETLDFVQECGDRWGVRIVWLEYRPEKPLFEVVSHNSASRNGEPFKWLIHKRRYLPNPVSRFCTTELKVRPAKRYLRSLGWDYWTNCIGLRADEPRRLKEEGVRHGDRWMTWQPLAHAGVTKRDVAKFWEAQLFDLRLSNVKGNCPLGNCDGCFLKSEANLAALARDYPDRHQWWQDMEDMVSQWTLGQGAQFRKEYSRREMGWMVRNQGDWIFDTEGALCQADGGECMD